MRCLKYILVALFFILPIKGKTSEISLNNLYTNPINQKLPEVIILHNTNNPCQNCNKAIDMIIAFLRQKYRKQIHAYLINAATHPEFANAFNAYGPLTLIIIRISDGAAFGYEKLEGLESAIDSPRDFNQRISEFINNFLYF